MLHLNQNGIENGCSGVEASSTMQGIVQRVACKSAATKTMYPKRPSRLMWGNECCSSPLAARSAALRPAQPCPCRTKDALDGTFVTALDQRKTVAPVQHRYRILEACSLCMPLARGTAEPFFCIGTKAAERSPEGNSSQTFFIGFWVPKTARIFWKCI